MITLLMFLMFGMGSSVLAMEVHIRPKTGKVHWQAEDRLQVVADDCVDHLGSQLESGLQGRVKRVIPLVVMMVKFDNGKITIIKYSEYGKLSKLEADQQSPRHSSTTFQPSLDMVASRALGKPTVVEAVADKLDSSGFAALLSSSRTLTILRHTPAYDAYVEAKQRHERRFAAWQADLARELDQPLRDLDDSQRRGIDPNAALIVDINIGEAFGRDPTSNPPCGHPRAISPTRGPTPHNRLSLMRHVRAQGEQETYTTKETLTSVTLTREQAYRRGPWQEIHSSSDPSVTVSRLTLVEALLITFNQYGAPTSRFPSCTGPRAPIFTSRDTIAEREGEEAAACMPNGRVLLSIAVASGVDEVKSQQLMNKLVDRLTKKQITVQYYDANTCSIL